LSPLGTIRFESLISITTPGPLTAVRPATSRAPASCLLSASSAVCEPAAFDWKAWTRVSAAAICERSCF